MNYKDPILKRIIDVLNEKGPNALKNRYGFGDPAIIQKSQLIKPRCYLSYDKISVTDSAMGMIETEATILINVVYDMTRDFGQGDNSWSHMSIAEIAAGRNESMKLNEDSILGALRKNDLTLPNFGKLHIDIGSETEVEFGSNNRNKGLVTSEAIVKINIKFEELRNDSI